jgi:hypothetical protein
MNKRLTAVAVAGTLGLGAVGAVTLAYPALASTGSPTVTPAPSATATPAPPTRPGAPSPQEFRQGREAAIKEQLKSLVADGTLTQAQADKVAAKLAAEVPRPGGMHRFGGPGRDFGGPFGVGLQQLEESTAKALGISADELRTQLRAGNSIADIAKKQNKSLDSVVAAIVQSARQQLAQAVQDKKITQETADQIAKNLPAQVKSFAENGRMSLHFGGPGRRDGAAPPAAPSDLPMLPDGSGATSESSAFGIA